VAGQIIAVQIGLAFASMIDPANGVSVPVLAQMLLMLVTLLFLAMNGHLVVFEVLAESFITLPVGTGLSTNHYWELAGKLGWVLGAGLLLVLPAITALLVVNLAFGIMTRAAPQLNIISIGFPMTWYRPGDSGLVWRTFSPSTSSWRAKACSCCANWRRRAEEATWLKAKVAPTKARNPPVSGSKSRARKARLPAPAS
jgi:hypothetical protein